MQYLNILVAQSNERNTLFVSQTFIIFSLLQVVTLERLVPG